MGTFGSPDSGKMYTDDNLTSKKDKKIPFLKILLILVFLMINTLIISLGGVNLFNLTGTLVFDSLLVLIYTITSFVYKKIKKRSYEKEKVIFLIAFIILFFSLFIMGKLQINENNTGIEINSEQNVI